MEHQHQQSKVDTFEKFTWKIENFSRLNDAKVYSEPFILGGYPWRILLYPRGNGDGLDSDLSIFLDAMETANMSKGWNRDVKFKLITFNQVNSNMTITKDTEDIYYEFNASQKNLGYQTFIPLTQFRDPQKGFLLKDACIIGTEISVIKATHENPIVAFLTSQGQIGHVQVILPKSKPEGQYLETLPIEHTNHTDVDLFSTIVGELIDFRSFGQIEKVFIPLLEEVCSQHPSLIECQKKRSHKFTTWAFTALGRVLYFLKTRKVKDMNDQARKDLLILWEELETSKFDLAWLEPHVQSIVKTENYAEKMMQVKKRKHRVVDLELQMERLKAKLVFTEVNLDVERDALKALRANDFKERDLDVELGYGSS